MQYMLLIYHEESALSETEYHACYEESTRLTHELHSQGKFVSASPLQPASTATTVRIRDNRRLITDGPFAETREQLGGFFMIEAQNLDEALEIAGLIPAAKFGVVEVRPVVHLSGLPQLP